MRRLHAAIAILGLSAAAEAAAWKTYTTATTYERRGAPASVNLDQAVSAKLGPVWSLVAGAEYEAAADLSFFDTPRKAGGRLGATLTLPGGVYLDALAGSTSWFADDGSSVSSAVFEGAFNAEGATWYLGFRDRVLMNDESTVYISTTRAKWYPHPLFQSDFRLIVATESDLGSSPSVSADLAASPFPSFRDFFAGAGAGAGRYARTAAEGGGSGSERSATFFAGAKSEGEYSVRLGATRRFGGRRDGLWEVELAVSKQL
jgi:hypothetical protein